jgi:hypothetical protein
MVILEKIRKKSIKFGLITTKKYFLQHLIADWKEKWELFFIWIEMGPAVISNAGLITRVEFAAHPKIYINNLSIIQKLIYYWFPIQYSVRTSPFRSAAYSLRCKTKKFEAILFPHRNHCRYLRTANRRTHVPEAAAVHP